MLKIIDDGTINTFQKTINFERKKESGIKMYGLANTGMNGTTNNVIAIKKCFFYPT